MPVGVWAVATAVAAALLTAALAPLPDAAATVGAAGAHVVVLAIALVGMLWSARTGDAAMRPARLLLAGALGAVALGTLIAGVLAGIYGATPVPSVAVMTAVVALARAMGLLIIAEGIEEPDQAEEAARAGVDLAQGYLFSRPAPAAEAARRFQPLAVPGNG